MEGVGEKKERCLTLSHSLIHTNSVEDVEMENCEMS